MEIEDKSSYESNASPLDFFSGFPHITEQIIEQFDNKTLKNCREVSKSWQNCIGFKKSWVRIVQIPTILKKDRIPYYYYYSDRRLGKLLHDDYDCKPKEPTYLLVAARAKQTRMFISILESSDIKNPIFDCFAL